MWENLNTTPNFDIRVTCRINSNKKKLKQMELFSYLRNHRKSLGMWNNSLKSLKV